MTTKEKLVVGSTILIGASALLMFTVSRKYAKAANNVISELRDIDYTLSRCREEVLTGNKEIAQGNQLLRVLVKQTATNIVDKK